MNNAYFEEMRKLGHNDELRYRMLIRGVKQLLQDQKKERLTRIRLLNSRKKKSPQPANWS